MHASDRFRRDLVGHLDGWVAAGLVTAEQAEGLRRHHALDALDAQAGSRFVSVIWGIGAVLVGLGVISFVAANWAMIPPAARAIGATALMIACDVGGHRLWTTGRSRVGSALLVLGTFLLGADIALMAQWYQVSGDGGGLFLAWGAGALAMAWGLRHPGVGAAAAIVLLGGASLALTAPLLPWAFALGVAPLAVVTVSAALFGLGLLGAIGTAGALVAEGGIAATGVATLLGAVGAMGAGWLADRPAFTAVARRIASAILGMQLVGWSFMEPWGSGMYENWLAPMAGGSGTAFGLACLALAGLAAWRRPASRPTLGGAAAAALALAALVGTGALGDGSAWAVNAILAAYALGTAWTGLQRASRGAFWWGVALLTAQVAGRFFEYDTGLLWKSAAFIGWGCGLIAVGVAFERAIARKQAAR